MENGSGAQPAEGIAPAPAKAAPTPAAGNAVATAIGPKPDADSLNILSSVGEISELVNTPFLAENGTIFVDVSGKIINFEISSDEILWENNLKENIIDFIQYSNALILVTKNNFYLLETKTGKLINQKEHTVLNPSYISLINSKLFLLGENNLVLFDLSTSDLKILKSIKFKNNDIDAVGYNDGNYYLKNEEAVYTLSE